MKKISKLATGLGAFALAVGLSGVGLTAYGAEVINPDTIDGSQGVSLTIQKFAGQPTGDGVLSHTAPSGATAPEGTDVFKFKITPIKVNSTDTSLSPTDPTFWKDLEALSKNDGYVKQLDTANAVELTINNSSDPKFAACVNGDNKTKSGLTAAANTIACTDGTGKIKQGAYYVEETSAPDGYQTANPFVITLPVYNPDTKKWDYSPVIFPKNQKVTLTKDLKNVTYDASGQVFEYDIHTDLPAAGWSPYKAEKPFRIIDKYPAEGVEYVADSVSVKLYKNLADYHAGTEYAPKVTLSSPGDYTVKSDSNPLVITFTAQGQKKIGDERAKDGNAGLTVAATLKFKVTDVSKAGYAVVNQGGVVFPGSDKTNDNPDKHTDNIAPILNVTLEKNGLNDDGMPDGNKLKNAHFSFFKCHLDGTKYDTDGTALAAYGQDGKTLATDFVATDGTVTAYNVPNVSKILMPGQTDKYYSLCVVETQAPDAASNGNVNYVKFPDPIPVQLATDAPKYGTGTAPKAVKWSDYNAGTDTVVDKETGNVTTPGKPASSKVTLGDTKDTVFGELPATGAIGVFGLLAAGAGFLIVGAVLRRRRDSKNA